MVHLFDETRVAACSVGLDLTARELDWRVVATANFDEWVESVAAGRGIGVLPDAAQRRGIHPAIGFISLRNAPPIPVSLVFRPGVREPLLRRFVQAALAAVRTPE